MKSNFNFDKFQICEEKEKREKEFKLDLMIERERIRLRVSAMLLIFIKIVRQIFLKISDYNDY